MKIQFMSDLHLEFSGYDWDIPKTDSDVIVLAGDIGVGIAPTQWALTQSRRHDKPVIILNGNHEYYHNDIEELWHEQQKIVFGTDVFLLNNESRKLYGVLFLGTTLWTDYLLYGPDGKAVAMKAASDFIVDHKVIWYENHVFSPQDALKFHEESMEWLNSELQSTGKKVVVTHHAPNAWASHPKYRGDMLTPAFASDLEGFILERKPNIWISGHSHWCYEKWIGDTFCVSNTRGYKGEGVVGFDPNLVIEV